MSRALLLLTLLFLVSATGVKAQREAKALLGSGLTSKPSNTAGSTAVQKANEGSLQVTVELFEYIFGVEGRALAVFQVTPSSATAKHKGGYFTDYIFQHYGLSYLIEYCRATDEESEIFIGGAHKDTIQCMRGDILHAIFVPEDAAGNQGEAVHFQVTVPMEGSCELIEGDELRLYPVPSSGSFTLDIRDFDQGAKIDIFSTTGAKLYSTAVTSSKMNISLPNLTDGIYLVRYSSARRSVSKLLIIRE